MSIQHGNESRVGNQVPDSMRYTDEERQLAREVQELKELNEKNVREGVARKKRNKRLGIGGLVAAGTAGVTALAVGLASGGNSDPTETPIAPEVGNEAEPIPGGEAPADPIAPVEVVDPIEVGGGEAQPDTPTEWSPEALELHPNFYMYQSIADNIRINPNEAITPSSAIEYVDNLGIALPGVEEDDYNTYAATGELGREERFLEWDEENQSFRYSQRGYREEFYALIPQHPMDSNLTAYSNVEFLNSEIDPADLSAIKNEIATRITQPATHEESMVLSAIDTNVAGITAQLSELGIDRDDLFLETTFAGYNPDSGLNAVMTQAIDQNTGYPVLTTETELHGGWPVNFHLASDSHLFVPDRANITDLDTKYVAFLQ